MQLTKEKAKINLARLVEKFKKEVSSGSALEYNEEATKMVFIQPFLKDVLGWDVNNRDEVSPEENTSRGRVDYGLKINNKIEIFIEAKPIKADLKKHVEQAIRYGYNRRDVAFVLLTDFEGLKLFDVTVKPDLRNPLKGIKLDLKWDEYISEFDRVWLLSKDSVAKGELNKLLLIKPKERISVDKAILADLDNWRESLAKDIFKRNSEMFQSGATDKDSDYLKEITQKILDRVIFIRSCEDRNLVHYRSLKELFEDRNETIELNAMLFLNEAFKQYNITFDSDLFSPQTWEANLIIGFQLVRQIVLETYNPYQFDVIPIEVLGNIYEQYLGYTIKITEHQIKYDLKSEVRKAGGVYYTPEYIVDYVISNTIGKLLKELSPNRIRKLRILDPACGSGSFLIRAYEEMLDCYLRAKKEKLKPRDRGIELDFELKEHEARLSIHEKRQILQQHIFGVDIDEQAVEVTKLSLMLKMLEDEHGFIPGQALLPILKKNIRCGNSLVSGDTLELKKYFGEDYYKINPFLWEREFSEIMNKGHGFDVVIGNPPWGQKEIKIEEQEKLYLHEKYSSIKGIYDIFRPFVERGIMNLNKNGIFGMVLPDIVLLKNYPDTRKFMLDNLSLINIDFWGMPFEKVNLDCITIIGKVAKETKKRLKNDILIHIRDKEGAIASQNILKQEIFNQSKDYKFNLFLSQGIIRILQKLKIFTPFENLFATHEGIHSGNIRQKLFVPKKTSNECKPLIFGRNELQRYSLVWNGLWVNYDPSIIDKKKGEYGNLGKPEYFNRPKIVIRRTGDHIVAAFDDKGYYFSNNAFVCSPLKDINLKYVVGILNSKLITWFFRAIQPRKGRIFAELKINQIAQFPIPEITSGDVAGRRKHDSIVQLVGIIMGLKGKLQSAKGSEQDRIERQIQQAELEIDNLVFALYNINDNDKGIIIGNAQ